MNPQELIKDFLCGKLDIVSFRRIYDESPEINDYLQKIIDDMREAGIEAKPFKCIIGGTTYWLTDGVEYLLAPETFPGLIYGNHSHDSVRNFLTYEFNMLTHDVETAAGASAFYAGVYAIYYQLDQNIERIEKYSDAYDFVLDVIPEYLCGGEAEKYIQKNIIPLYPDTMKKGERKKAIRAKIKEEFKSEKGYPHWPQSSEWPLGKDGKPTTYIGTGKSEGDLRRFRFRDESTGEIITVEQYY